MSTVVIGARPHAILCWCHACGRRARCALIWVDKADGNDVRKSVRLCSGCCRYAWNAAKAVKR